MNNFNSQLLYMDFSLDRTKEVLAYYSTLAELASLPLQYRSPV